MPEVTLTIILPSKPILYATFVLQWIGLSRLSCWLFNKTVRVE